jgi:hypothetical protein
VVSWAGNHAIGGKHRTEVTEVTEGDGQWPGVLWATPADSGRETHARGKASHRGHGGHRGGLASGRVFFGDARGTWGETHARGKHRTEVTEVTEGGWPVAGCSLGDTGGFLARNTR